jgi:hypothetical protein
MSQIMLISLFISTMLPGTGAAITISHITIENCDRNTFKSLIG